jgi:hypothetical protein
MSNLMILDTILQTHIPIFNWADLQCTTLHLQQHQLAIIAEVDGGTAKQQVTDISS